MTRFVMLTTQIYRDFPFGESASSAAWDPTE
jgi:hypothetical protein